MIRIIGIGSPFGDDACGPAAAQLLADEPPAGTDIVIADRSGAALIELLEGVEATILIDAVRSGAPPGTIHDLDLRDLPTASSLRAVSSHDLGVSEAMQLVTALGRPPVRGRFLGIEVGASPGVSSDHATPAVWAATAKVVRRARQWVSRLGSASSGSRDSGENDEPSGRSGPAASDVGCAPPPDGRRAQRACPPVRCGRTHGESVCSAPVASRRVLPSAWRG